MAFWILDQWNDTIDYPTLGFIAEPDDILEADAAPDSRWSSTGSGPETVTRYGVGGDPSYVEPTDGHLLAWSAAENRYAPVPSAAATVAAAEAAPGKAEIATQAEVNTGTDDTRIVTPLKMATRLAAAFQPISGTLTGIAGTSPTADQVIYANGAGTFTTTGLTSLGRNIIDETTTAGVRAILLARALRRTINTQTGTSYTLVLTDEEKVIQVNNAAAHTLTVPTDAAVAFTNGTEIEVFRLGAGAVTIADSGGEVAILSRGGLRSINGQYGSVRLRKAAVNTWVLTGDLV